MKRIAASLLTCALACGGSPSLAPASDDKPVPAKDPGQRVAEASAQAQALDGPITAASMTDLSAPPASAAACLTQDDPDAYDVSPVVVDAKGDVFALDEFGGQVIVQPGGDRETAKVLATVPRTHPLLDEQLLDLVDDGDRIVFSSVRRNFDDSAMAWAVRAVPKTGGTAQVLAKGDGARTMVGDLAIDAQHIYLERSKLGPEHYEAELFRMPREGGELERVAGGMGVPAAWTVHDGTVVVAKRRGDGSELVQIAVGAEPEVIATTEDVVGSLATAHGTLYYLMRDFRIGRAPGVRLFALDRSANESTSEAVAAFNGWTTPLHVDAGVLYWTEHVSEALDAAQRVRARPGRNALNATLHHAIGHGQGWTVEDGRVYWGTPQCVQSAALAPLAGQETR